MQMLLNKVTQIL